MKACDSSKLTDEAFRAGRDGVRTVRDCPKSPTCPHERGLRKNNRAENSHQIVRRRGQFNNALWRAPLKCSGPIYPVRCLISRRPRVRRLAAGGRWIRTIGTPQNFFGRPSIPAQFTFRNINRLACDRDRWFEFISLQPSSGEFSCEPDSRRNLARAGSPFHRQGLLRRQEIRLAAVTTRHLRSPHQRSRRR